MAEVAKQNLDSVISSLSAQQLSAWQKCRRHTQGHMLFNRPLPPYPTLAAVDAFILNFFILSFFFFFLNYSTLAAGDAYMLQYAFVVSC